MGIKEVMGLWMAQTEGAKFWLQVVTELKNRGVADIFISCVDAFQASHRELRDPSRDCPLAALLFELPGANLGQR